jgi:hypothetical protein
MQDQRWRWGGVLGIFSTYQKSTLTPFIRLSEASALRGVALEHASALLDSNCGCVPLRHNDPNA